MVANETIWLSMEDAVGFNEDHSWIFSDKEKNSIVSEVVQTTLPWGSFTKEKNKQVGNVESRMVNKVPPCCLGAQEKGKKDVPSDNNDR